MVGNLAQRQGGGIFVRDGSVNLDNSTIDGNVSGDSGGGLYQDEDPYSRSGLSLNNVTFSNNRAAEGGGLYTEESVRRCATASSPETRHPPPRIAWGPSTPVAII